MRYQPVPVAPEPAAVAMVKDDPGTAATLSQDQVEAE